MTPGRRQPVELYRLTAVEWYAISSFSTPKRSVGGSMPPHHTRGESSRGAGKEGENIQDLSILDPLLVASFILD